MTKYEDEFLTYLKKELFFSGIKIKQKISLGELCNNRKDLDFMFSRDDELVNSILIDFVLYKKDKVVMVIEIIDETNEINNTKGENMLKDMLFNRMGYTYFKVSELDKLKEAAKAVKLSLK